MVTEHSVKQRVEVVEQVDYFDGVAEGGDGGKTHDVTEVDGHLVKILWLHCATSLESLCHRSESERYGEGGSCQRSTEYWLLIGAELTVEASLTAASLFSASPPPALRFSL